MNHLPIPDAIRADIAQVQALVATRIAERPVVQRIVEQFADTGEELPLRAVLTILAARLGSPAPGVVLHAAAAAELIHAATRVHDQLVDEGERRSGSVAHEADWQGDAGLMVGDYLFALAASEMAQAPDPEIIAAFSGAVMRISEAQLAPVMQLTPTDTAIAHYLARVGGKQGALFEAACVAGAVCGGLAAPAIAALRQFGFQLGIAQQLASDARALTQPDGQLRPGVITLPLIYAAAAGLGPTLAPLLIGTSNPAVLAQADAAIRRTNALARTQADAQQALASALVHLNSLPASEAHANLVAVARAMVE